MSFFGQVSTKEHYGVRLALRLAETFYKQKPVSLAEISKAENLSMKYLEHLIVPFKKANWLKCIRGRQGGYLMKKDPNTITFKDVVLLLDDDLSLIECLKKNPSYKCSFNNSCPSKKAWKQIQNALEGSMKKIKLSHLIKI